jgi:hypothetical protein
MHSFKKVFGLSYAKFQTAYKSVNANLGTEPFRQLDALPKVRNQPSLVKK